MFNCSVGSIWRKWDLHMHSNASDGKMSPKEIIEKVKELGIDVIAITDHHTAKNVDEMVMLGTENNIVVIPGVEFRTEYGDKSVHMIGLFPYEYNEFKMDSSGIYENVLIPLGLGEDRIKIKGKQGKTGDISDEKAFKDGLCRVQVDFKTAADRIHSFGGIVTVHAGSKSNSFDEEMKHGGKAAKNVTDLFDSLGTVKEELLEDGYIDICEIRKCNDNDDFYWNVFNKVSIIASDAHELEEIGRQFTWIKADPTINGLRQTMLEKERIYLGDEPEIIRRVKHNPTRYIRKLSIDKVEGYNNDSQKWFEDISIPLNSELVAIIGNKGSGKSAIADIIGLLMNSDHSDDFQFLEKSRFLKKGFAENFISSLELCSGQRIEDINLATSVRADEPIKVKYFPQNYFESLCNEVGKVNKFRNEIESVVYQYLPESDKLGMNCFQELVNLKSKSAESEISSNKKKISDINRELIKLEDKSSPGYIRKIKNEISRVEQEIEATNKNKPDEVKNPSTEADSYEVIKQRKELDEKNIALEQINDEINKKREELNTKKIEQQNLKQLKSEIVNKYKEFIEFIEEILPKMETFNIDVNHVFSVVMNCDVIDVKIKELEDKIESLQKDIGDTIELPEETSLIKQMEKISKEIEKIKNGFDKEQKAYQKFIEERKVWEENRKKLIGSKEEYGSLEFFKNELDFLQGDLLDKISNLRKERIIVSKEIFSKKLEIKKIYDDIKVQIDDTLKELNDQSIEIISCFKFEDSFETIFLNFINKKKIGSFYGMENSKKMLWENVVEDRNFESKEDVEEFLKRVVEYLETDMRTDQMASTYIGDIVSNRNEFYSYVFSMDFLSPKYEMMQNGKSLDELSPGEKGALLLVFYLALDKTEMPIIIDQPEDNLDNHSVAKILVPYIKSAKEHRQIIMVTHNPNLAIVADAEQIIYVNIDKSNGNKFECSTGSIENSEINEKIVDVLEGTMPAFKTRSNKYHE